MGNLTEKQKEALKLGRVKGIKKNRPSGLKYKLKKKNPTSFKKGCVPWNKGKKGVMPVPWNKGLKGTHFSPDTEFKKGDTVGDKNNNWKGDDVGYFALHTWVGRKLGKSTNCEFCGSEKNVHWANKSHEYKRELDDWIQLCRKCHAKYDLDYGWGDATRRYPEIKGGKNE